MEYVKNADGSFGKLPKRNVDFGGGLERLAAATRGNSDIFLIDVFDAARSALEKRSEKSYSDTHATRSFRIILDHIRAASFLIASGVRPSNTEQGYILRRLIRRSIREADKLGIKEAVLAEVAEGFGAAYADAYPMVKEHARVIREELEKEEIQFRKTLMHGLRELEKRGNDADAFTLFTTYGFPVELTAEIMKERGLSIDSDAIQKKMQEHQALSRAGAAQKFAGGLADHQEQTIKYHTAHHLLLKALQMVLGKDVHQRGSNITSERLRIDFSYGQKMTSEQKAEVEKIVNEKIAESVPVIRTDMKKEEAEKLGAEHEFGATYPDTVSVYSVGPLNRAFSIEFCGGPHVSNTRELGESGKKFKILKEEASSAGIRRIKAVLE
jgi:alanyl-tRNA synthetase